MFPAVGAECFLVKGRAVTASSRQCLVQHQSTRRRVSAAYWKWPRQRGVTLAPAYQVLQPFHCPDPSTHTLSRLRMRPTHENCSSVASLNHVARKPASVTGTGWHCLGSSDRSVSRKRRNSGRSQIALFVDLFVKNESTSHDNYSSTQEAQTSITKQIRPVDRNGNVPMPGQKGFTQGAINRQSFME